jgi:pyruvate formate lyase activating enzyme
MAGRLSAAAPARHWHPIEDGRIQCDLCPRACRLHEGQAGFCSVRVRENDQIRLAVWGRTSGFAVDPIEKKPLYHFLPGSQVYSFGTAGCNLACRHCQNWELSRGRIETGTREAGPPSGIARAAARHGCESIAFTYNEPVVFLEYAIDVALACRERGLLSIAVTNGYVCAGPRRELFGVLDAANVDLKSFDDRFYQRITGGRLEPVLETLEYVARETDVWLEITNLLIPGLNDSNQEIDVLTRWVVDRLGPAVPLHFTAFHPAGQLRDLESTPSATLRRARAIARSNGVLHAYTGNVPDPEGARTACTYCGETLIGREGYSVATVGLDSGGCCLRCGRRVAGVFGKTLSSR